MFEHVLDQLQPDTRQTVQTILVPPDPSDPTQEQQAPSVSLAKLEQTWAALWQEWDHIVAEAAQEDGNYIVRERPWEEPYFDSTTFVRDLERVAQQMQPMLRTAFELVFRTLYRGFCLLRTEYGFCGLPAPLSGLRDGCNGHGFAPIGSEPC